ncbi:MAG: polysaccharide biosynthesis protein [Magnetococcales bacterium]|nr:polysaccharide biosynthesis protein [Magnetococcales bacterium]
MTTTLLEQVLGRSKSLFKDDLESADLELIDKITGSRILVVGAAGSIGSSFVKQLLAFTPKTLHLVDPAENNLVELVRDLRSSTLHVPTDFMTLSIPMGSVMFDYFLESQQSYDYVVNFSALKHVRVERDPYSLMQMLETNIFSLQRLLAFLKISRQSRVFSVSSDKAVNPANLMGASKALMEQLLYAFSGDVPYSTARFANVAFSDGSLLHGFIRRFEKGQPLSAPFDVRRYFISHEESGQLCLLACFLGENREVFIPRLSPQSDLKTFSEIAELFLKERGYTPIKCASEIEAKEIAGKGDLAEKKEWPCYFSGSDTSGEKPVEEFVGRGERADFSRFKAVGIIAGQPPMDEGSLSESLAALKKIKEDKNWLVGEIAGAVKLTVPELDHQISSRNLDQKM